MSRTGAADLVLCAHGTRDPEGARVLAEVAAATARALPATSVHLAFADVQEPSIARAVGERAGSSPLVVVPLLLSYGYHVEADILDAAATSPRVLVSAPVGPDERLAQVLADRLAAAGVPSDDPVVLGVAGSTRPRAVRDVQTTRAQLAALRPGPVVVGHGAAQSPSVAEAVAALRRSGSGVVAVAAYLLAPGHFHGVLRAAGADVVTEPLGAAGPVVEVVVDRYAQASRALRSGPRA